MAVPPRFRAHRPLVAIAALALGCASQPEQPAPPSGASAVSRHGYALLFSLLTQEKDVSKLLIIHRERPDLRALIEEVAETCGAAHDRLWELAEAPPALDLEALGLPAAETQTREAIQKTRTALLLTESGKEFELQLLLAQNEALTYMLHLSDVLARAESDSARIEFLRALWKDLHRLHADLLELLRSRYRWVPPDTGR